MEAATGCSCSCHRDIDTWLGGIPNQVDNISSQSSLPSTTPDCSPTNQVLDRRHVDDTDDLMTDDWIEEKNPRESQDPSLNVFRNRPILIPKAPSKKTDSVASRSPTSTRKLLLQLEYATPPVKFYYPGNPVVRPEQVTTLHKRLIKDLEYKIIPRSLETRLREVDPEGSDSIPDFAFYDDAMTPDEQERLWAQVHSIYVKAQRCANYRKDENDWIQVVRSVLEVAGIGSISDMLEIVSVQTQEIDKSYLPVLPNNAQPLAKKADLALAFSEEHPQVQPTLRKFRDFYKSASLSHMTDAYSSTVPLVSGIEVKESGGDYNEALLQLGLWSAAGLRHVSELAGEKTLRPFLGWTVVGHDWRLHLCWEENGSVVSKSFRFKWLMLIESDQVVLGPWPALTRTTSDYYSLFVLLHLLQRIRDWLSSDYFLWLQDDILNPLMTLPSG